MRRSSCSVAARSFVSASVAVLALAAATTYTERARAQDYPPPAPMAPPAPMDPNAPGTTPGAPPPGDATQAKLNESEAEDSGRGFELFWLNGEVGGSYTDMAQFSSDTLQVEKTSAGGPFFGLGAGLRFVVLVLGARVRYNALSSFNLWQINGELGLKLPIRSFDVLIGGHGGYSFVGSLGDAGLATSTNVPDAKDRVSIRGFNAGLDVALDYYVSPTFSVGVGAFGDVLLLNRPKVDIPSAGLTAEQQAAIANDPLYQKSGTSAGFQAGAALRLGLHFGL
jgi:hypothetical protein